MRLSLLINPRPGGHAGLRREGGSASSGIRARILFADNRQRKGGK
jgi:hypothetical protein